LDEVKNDPLLLAALVCGVLALGVSVVMIFNW
jgi:hypothetical protein